MCFINVLELLVEVCQKLVMVETMFSFHSKIGLNRQKHWYSNVFTLCFIAEHSRLDSLHYAFSAQCRPLQVPLNAAAFCPSTTTVSRLGYIPVLITIKPAVMGRVTYNIKPQTKAIIIVQ